MRFHVSFWRVTFAHLASALDKLEEQYMEQYRMEAAGVTAPRG